jgi:hypothetical protein
MDEHHHGPPVRLVTGASGRRRPGVNSYVLAAATLCLAGCGAPSASAPPNGAAPDAGSRRAILVSFDALNERRALETVPPEAIPAFRTLFEQGSCAEYALPAWPSKTSASHAAIWTGAFGDVNGVAANWQPKLPRDRHRITDLGSGYSSSALRAEPIWITAALAGRRVVGHHPTQAPGAPGYPPVRGERSPADAIARAAAVSALADPRLLVLNGYNSDFAPDLALTAEDGVPQPATGWRNLSRLEPTVPPRAIAWAVGADSVFAVFYGRDRYTHVLVAPARDAAHGVVVAAAEVEQTDPRGRDLARHFSDPLVLATAAGRAYVRVRLFSLEPDGSDFLLFQPAIQIVEGNHPADAAAYAAAIGGWTGNGAQNLLWRGDLGTVIREGGDGTAELRYLETLEYTTRQFMRGSEWAWARGAELQLDYFPLIDETDHVWYGDVVPSSPAYRAESAALTQRMRARAWSLADLRLAALQRMVAADANAALFVTGDHGMRPTWRTFRPNVALAAAGLLAVDDSGRVDAARTRAVAPDGLYIMVNTTEWLDGMVPPDSAAAVLATADSAIRAVRGPDGEPVVTETWIVTVDDPLGRGGPVGGGLYFETAPGYDWSGAPVGDAAGEGRVGGQHGFPATSPDMYTVLCASSSAFPAERLPPARVTDAAASVAAWLGIPAPRGSVGRTVVGGR